jgi:hypothetical protein
VADAGEGDVDADVVVAQVATLDLDGLERRSGRRDGQGGSRGGHESTVNPPGGAS